MLLTEEGRAFHNKCRGHASVFRLKFAGFGRSIQTSFLKVKRSILIPLFFFRVMTYTGGFKAGETRDFVLGYNNRGRYVTIQLLDQNFLTLCEVEVFAARRKSIHFIQYNHGKFGHNCCDFQTAHEITK